MRTLTLAVAVAATAMGANLWATSPASIQQGQALFEQEWSSRNPTVGSDGLGPLFNARSCVACHHQGGIGGGGDSRFNAQTVAIEHMSIVPKALGRVDDDVVARVLNAFHPGFVRNGLMVNTAPLVHHGGTVAYREASKKFLANIPATFSEFGGPTTSEETRKANNGPIDFQKTVGHFDVAVRARLFQRNTTSLFGSGLIDQVPEKLIEQQARAQKHHAEISGRPSTLNDGRVGKFGWRGNVASLVEFNDQACANEVGLETARMTQPGDPTVPGYRNPGHDISDNQIRTMTSFVAALPAPMRRIPEDSELRAEVERGEHVFASVGCAVCHVPNMGPALGVYSDLLLHDMGPESFDLNPAEPYRIGFAVQKYVARDTTSTRTEMSQNTTGYYGGSATMSTGSVADNRSMADRSAGPARDDQRVGARGVARPAYLFNAPTRPGKSKVIDLGTRVTHLERNVESSTEAVEQTIINRRTRRAVGTRSGERRTTRTTLSRKDEGGTAVVYFEPTTITQEWRTPPLWGVADSAPYMHDGRAGTLLEAITLHEGEAAGTRDRFLNLSVEDRHALVAFLETMVAPPSAPQPTVPIAAVE